jgi:hypothetical protein
MSRTFKEYKPAPHNNDFQSEKPKPVEQPSFVQNLQKKFEPRPAITQQYTEQAPMNFPALPEQKMIAAAPEAAAENDNKAAYFEKLKSLEGTLKGVILDRDNNIMAESDVKDLSKDMEKSENAEAVVFDGIITQRLVDIANKAKIRTLVGVKSSRIENRGKVEIHTK